MVEKLPVGRRSDDLVSVSLRRSVPAGLCMFGSPWNTFCRHLSRGRTHSTDAHRVVGQARQPHQLRVTLDAPQAGLAKAAHGFAPAEKLLDTFANNLAGPIAGRAEGASIWPGGVVSGVDGHMRSDALREQ